MVSNHVYDSLPLDYSRSFERTTYRVYVYLFTQLLQIREESYTQDANQSLNYKIESFRKAWLLGISEILAACSHRSYDEYSQIRLYRNTC